MTGGADLRRILAANVKKRRQEEGLTQQALADAMAAQGFDWVRETVAQVERFLRGPTGSRRVTIEEVLGIARALDSSVDELLTGTVRTSITPSTHLDSEELSHLLRRSRRERMEELRAHLSQEIALAQEFLEADFVAERRGSQRGLASPEPPPTKRSPKRRAKK